MYLFRCPGKNSLIGCTSGSYSAVGEELCSTCPKGSYCPSAEMPEHMICPLGEYTDSTGSTSCTSCPAGHQCKDVSASPTTCPDGSYSGGGTSECTLCPAGSKYTFLCVYI